MEIVVLSDFSDGPKAESPIPHTGKVLMLNTGLEVSKLHLRIMLVQNRVVITTTLDLAMLVAGILNTISFLEGGI